jgi:multicomponent Na+:H+ antiporter subunit D
MRTHNQHHQTRFYSCFSIALGCAVGIAFAGNLLTLFIFYELLTLSTYPLVTHAGDVAARRGGRIYLGYLLGSSVILLLMAMIWTWSIAGTLDFREGGILHDKATPYAAGVLLVLYIFGTGKAAVMPVHRWLPAAMIAPTPVSALLHAVAVVKAGVFTVLKIAVYIFGIDYLAGIPATRWLMYIAAITILLAGYIALRQDNLKLRLAWSTISHLSYIVLGALLATSSGIVGGGMHIVMHAFAKITLFFCAGAILVTTHKTRISEMAGIGWRMPITMTAFTIASLSIIGLPPLGGFWSKWLLGIGTQDAQQQLMLGVLLLGALLNIAYLLPLSLRAFFSRETGNAGSISVQEAPTACLAALVLTTACCILLFFSPNPLWRLIYEAVT